jgi:ankyrin repeat protein
LAHFSLKEFLTTGKLLDNVQLRKYNIDPLHADAYLAMVSLSYLSFREMSLFCNTTRELEAFREKHRFVDYATLHGGVHLGRLEKASSTLISLLNGLFVREISLQELPDYQEGVETSVLKMNISIFCSPVEDEYSSCRRDCHISMSHPFSRDCVEFLATQTVKNIEDRPNCVSWLRLFRILSNTTRQDHPTNVTPLYYASLFGWNAGVTELLRLNRNRAITSDLNHALRAAAIGNNCDIIRQLCHAGAQVEASSAELGSPLQSAAFCGHVEAVKELLGLGAHAEEEDSFYRPGGTVGSALQGAAIRGDTKLVQILLDHGANVNSNRGWLGTPLQAVMERGMEEMAIFLINSPGFDGSVTGGYYGSALRLACLTGGSAMDRILRAMLNQGASPNQRVGAYGSLLEIASHFGCLDEVLLLLEYNAVPDTCVGQFGSAIQAASMNGDERMVERLLGHGADVNSPGYWLGRDYAAQTLEGQPEHGKVLILQEGTGFLAYGHSEMTKAFFAPSLKAAKRLRNVEHNKIYFLLENEPTHQNGHFGNPLQAAACRGHTGVLRLLLQNGADVNKIGGFFGTALQAAASQGHIEAVKLLLENGACTNLAPAGHYGSPLAAAVALNLGHVARALLNHSADSLARDDHGWDARDWSSLYRRDMVYTLNETEMYTSCAPPAAWSLVNKSPKLGIDDSGRGVQSLGESPSVQSYCGITFELAAAVLADHPIPPYQDYYFEVKIVDEGSIRYVINPIQYLSVFRQDRYD